MLPSHLLMTEDENQSCQQEVVLDLKFTLISWLTAMHSIPTTPNAAPKMIVMM